MPRLATQHILTLLLGLPLVFTAAVCAGVAIVAAGEAKLDASQRALLEAQLAESYKCTLDSVLFLRTVEVGNQTALEGRIRCLDQREVDIRQDQGSPRFDLRLCQPTVC